MVNELLKVIDRFVTDMQVILGAKVAREKEDGAGLTGDKNGAIHTEDRALYTKDGAVHVHNKYGVGPSSSFAAASIVCIANRNGAAVFEGKNHNEAEGADFSTVFDSALENSGTGNQRTAPWMLRFEQIVHLTSMYSIFLNKLLRPMKLRVEICKRVEEGYKFDSPPQRGHLVLA